MSRYKPLRKTFILWVILSVLPCWAAPAEVISLIMPGKAAPRVEFGAAKLLEALKEAKLDAAIMRSEPLGGRTIHLEFPTNSPIPPEGFRYKVTGDGKLFILGGNDSGLLYGCLELARQIHETGHIPSTTLENIDEAPAMNLRGTCIGMQKTGVLPGRHVYEYPYTQKLFPWFYDKQLWNAYLDFLVANRLNALYLWSGHPFASLVRLKDYPYAVEVSENEFEKNQDQFRWLATECDKRGIWLVQMFYNILVSQPFAETNGITTQNSTPTPLTEDYTRKSIAEFVKQYPNVGLMACLGEAMSGTANQLEWCTNVIIRGVFDGMLAAGLKAQPPIVIRTHAMNAEAVMPVAYQVYSNLFTETKYNGESLTTWEPRGKDQATHLTMSQLGPHLVNVHILSNLEPFRYGDTGFIKKCVQASRNRLGASGIHLYPLTYWNWPYSPDMANLPLLQWQRDWIWFEAWAHYAWNPDVPEKADHYYWISRLADFYGSTSAAEKLLDAYNFSGEVAPRLVRRFGITEGNRQTLSLGMTLDQLVNPKKYGVISDLWESQSPPGERLDEYVNKEWNHQPHVGETPESVIIEVLDFAARAVAATESAGPLVTKNQAEFQRLRNDMLCIQAMAETYAAKARAAALVLRFDYSHHLADLQSASQHLDQSFHSYKKLAALTEKTYRFANAMQTSQRKIPVPGGVKGISTNYLWSQLLPLYQQELADFKTKLAQLKLSGTRTYAPDQAPVQPWPTAQFKLISTNAETYPLAKGARVFTDRNFSIKQIAPELSRLTGIRFAHEAAKQGKLSPFKFEFAEPVQVLVGYFNSNQKAWLPAPKLETAAQADDRGGVDTVIENAADISSCPGLNVHAFRFDAGQQQLEFPAHGSFVILGVVPQSAPLAKRDANLGKKFGNHITGPDA